MTRVKPTACRELTCHGLIAFLKNPQTWKTVPVDWDSLDNDEKEAYERGAEIAFIPMKHRNHGKACTNPQRFFGKGKK